MVRIKEENPCKLIVSNKKGNFLLKEGSYIVKCLHNMETNDIEKQHSNDDIKERETKFTPFFQRIPPFHSNHASADHSSVFLVRL